MLSNLSQVTFDKMPAVSNLPILLVHRLHNHLDVYLVDFYSNVERDCSMKV